MAQREAPPRFLEAGKVAKLLHVSPKTIARWAVEGKLPYVRTLGGHRRYDPAVVAGIIAGLDQSDGGAA
jgi:excisionase family DNA binding protein